MTETLRNCQECREKQANFTSACARCRTLNTALQRYAESNIPVRYWNLEMDKDFVGDDALLNTYKNITANLAETYKKGPALCLAGSHGTGKSMCVTNILKRASEKGYSAHYCTLNDIVGALITSNSEERSLSRNQLLMVDFLVIDEFDPRFMGSENAADLYGRVLEDIFRTRTQNNLPLFMCTNSPRVVDSFTGSIKASVSSLMNYVTQVSVLGKDQRKEGK